MSNRACYWSTLAAAGLVASVFSVRCAHSWRPFCWGCRGWMRSMWMPRRSRQDGELAEAIQGVGGGKGHAVVGANGLRKAKFREGALEDRGGEFFLRR